MKLIAIPLIAAMIATAAQAQHFSPVSPPEDSGAYGIRPSRPTDTPPRFTPLAHAPAPPLVLVSAESKPSGCFDHEIENVIFRGVIVLSVLTEADELNDRPAGTNYLAIALDQPICFDSSPKETTTLLEVGVAKKWLGHRVVIFGDLVEEDYFIAVHTIKDISNAVAEPASKASPANAD